MTPVSKRVPLLLPSADDGQVASEAMVPTRSAGLASDPCGKEAAAGFVLNSLLWFLAFIVFAVIGAAPAQSPCATLSKPD